MAQTRKVTELEAKLKATLRELKDTQAECTQLRTENEDGAEQFQHLIQRNSVLKNELTAMERRIEELSAECVRLQDVIASMEQCRDTFEASLERASFLERQLAEAKEDIKSLQAEKQLAAFANTSALYNELVPDHAQFVQCQDANLSVNNSLVPTIDLTATPISNTKRNSLSSSNKIKKYVKLSKFIKKSENIVKKQKNSVKEIPIRQQKLDLKVQLLSCEDTIKSNNKFIKELQNKICSLQSELQSISSKYELSKKVVGEFTQALKKLNEEKKMCSSGEEIQNMEAFSPDNAACAAATALTKVVLPLETLPPLQVSPGTSQLNSSTINSTTSTLVRPPTACYETLLDVLEEALSAADDLLKRNASDPKSTFRFRHISPEELLSAYKALNMKNTEDLWGRSTTDAAATLVGIINDAWEAGQDVIGVFCDLSKAFDCVDHNILKNKLKFYGVTGAALDVLSSYLDNRTQKVEINRAASNSAPVHMGVPQGSIIGTQSRSVRNQYDGRSITQRGPVLLS
ncbi:polyamine-modulated factor 1-binding protein 1-like [Plodia interpunctella]|uniref:polyamine-modulated factor 1-binding protein 1-like n=1 Tax=Plodia interpunctella TaxID=58824 RepID=UPI003100F75E